MKYTGRLICMAIFLVSSAVFKINAYFKLGYIPAHEYIYSLLFIFPVWWAGKKYDESNYYFQKLLQTTELIKKSEEKYRLITDNSYDLIKSVDKFGIIHYASPSHLKLLGLPPDEFIGKHVFEGIHKNFIGMIESWLFKNDHAGALHCEVQRKHEDGTWIWLETYVQPLKCSNGNVEQYIITSRDVTEKKKYEEELKALAFYDSLTGVPNRRLFSEIISQEIREAKRYNHKIALMYMDIDNFKQINDKFGHGVGDELLTQFTRKIKSCIRESDVLARLGGDEFVILLPKIHKEVDTISMANKILNLFRTPWFIEEYTFKTTTSIGIAVVNEGEDYKSLIKRADRALYDAKKSGRNTFKISE